MPGYGSAELWDELLIINELEGYERNWQLFEGCVKPKEISATIVRLRAKNWARELPTTEQAC